MADHAGFENLAEQQRLFIRLWCLKEAYVKATGRGIMAPPGLKAFTFELLLNIKVRPSQRRPPATAQTDEALDKENTPPGSSLPFDPAQPSGEREPCQGLEFRPLAHLVCFKWHYLQVHQMSSKLLCHVSEETL